MGLIGKILPLVAIGAAIAFAANIFGRPASASLSAGALSQTGSAIGDTLTNLGVGASNLGGGIGSGLSGLLQPAWEIKNLFEAFSSNVSGSANVGAVAQVDGETNQVTGVNRPSSSTITWSSGKTATVAAALSPAAKAYYGARGVAVN